MEPRRTILRACLLATASLVVLTFAAGGAEAQWVLESCPALEYPECCSTSNDLPVGPGPRGNTVCTPRVPLIEP